MTTRVDNIPLIGAGDPNAEEVIETNLDNSKRVQKFRLTLLPLQVTLITHLIWMIAFFVIFGETDPAACSGPLYHFGNVARWFLLGFFCWDLITVIAIALLRDKTHPDPNKHIPSWFPFINFAYMTIAIGFWVYSIIALTGRDGCLDQPLTKLAWIWVIIYAILPLAICISIIFKCLWSEVPRDKKGSHFDNHV